MSGMKTLKLNNPPKCPTCHLTLSGVTNPFDDEGPKPGDVTVCASCGEWLEFTKSAEGADSVGLKHVTQETVDSLKPRTLDFMWKVSGEIRKRRK